MGNIATHRDSQIRELILSRYISKITGLADVDLVIEIASKVCNTDGYINLDYNDIMNVLKDVDEIDAIIVEGKRDEILSVMQKAFDALTDAHSNHTINKLLMQIFYSDLSQLYMSDIQIINGFLSTLGEGVEICWGVTEDNTGDNIKIGFIAGFK